MDYTITEVGELFCLTWHKDSGSHMKERPSNGLVICDESEFSFFADGNEIKTDRRHLLVLPQRSSYHFKCRKSGVTYTYNFFGKVPNASPYTIELPDNSRCLSFALELRCVSDMYSKTGLMYRILGEALGNCSSRNIPYIIRPQVDYIQTNFGSTELSNSFLASLTNISEVYFRKLFARTFSTTPHEYIVNLRIDKAKRMLLEGKNVSETAFACGFSNLYYFSGAFKRLVGVSPSEYVKQNGII